MECTFKGIYSTCNEEYVCNQSCGDLPQITRTALSYKATINQAASYQNTDFLIYGFQYKPNISPNISEPIYLCNVYYINYIVVTCTVYVCKRTLWL